MTDDDCPLATQDPMTKPGKDIQDLIDIMRQLRTPVTGCPWDLQQDFRSIAPYTIEEAYEVADAIERGDLEDLKDELGDLLLQVVFHARMAEEQSAFAFGDVVEAIAAKMIRRHPHVFGNAKARDAGAVKERWEEIKADEKAERAGRHGAGREAGLLDDVPAALPALTRAVTLQRRAATVGFDWNDPRAVIAKIREEIAELEAELAGGDDGSGRRLEDELGDLFFAAANLARHLKADPEAALRRANAKFVRRFRHIETALAAQGRDTSGATLEEMEALWAEAKSMEGAG